MSLVNSEGLNYQTFSDEDIFLHQHTKYSTNLSGPKFKSYNLN
jgi:hypothetical protein